ncbi:MAG: hypothetical protein QME51_09715 [Planctomycetota bacterium]|nr:hypothetical protein [Planctomycetota bacterium]
MRYWFLLLLFLLSGCGEMKWQVTSVQVKQEDVALQVCLDNKSSYVVKANYPVASGYIGRYQHLVLKMPQLGQHNLSITAYVPDRDRGDVYTPVVTIDVPVFLDGTTTVSAHSTFVGYLLELTDGMFSPEKTGRPPREIEVSCKKGHRFKMREDEKSKPCPKCGRTVTRDK